jgi:hypothetical protein
MLKKCLYRFCLFILSTLTCILLFDSLICTDSTKQEAKSLIITIFIPYSEEDPSKTLNNAEIWSIRCKEKYKKKDQKSNVQIWVTKTYLLKFKRKTKIIKRITMESKKKIYQWP